MNELKAAAEAGDIARLEALKQRGVNLDLPVESHPPIVWAAARNRPEAVRWLLQNGAFPDAVGQESRWTALMSAANGGHADIAMMLMEAGADPRRADSRGRTALTLARDNNHVSLLRLMTETPDEVVFTEPVHDRVVQEIYNFRRLERFTFVRKSEAGDVEAVQRESFSDLKENPSLRKAFEIHRQRGGKLTEEQVFDTMLPKKAFRGLTR